MLNKVFTLDCAFLNAKQVLNLLKVTSRQIVQLKIKHIYSEGFDGIKYAFANSILTDAVLDILKSKSVTPLEQALLRGEKLMPGQLVWVENTFSFKGTIKAREDFAKGLSLTRANFHSVIKYCDGLTISGYFRAEHLFGDTSVYTLTGRKRIFMFGIIEEFVENHMILKPIFIGNKILSEPQSLPLNTDYLQISIEDIDEFKKAKKINRRGLKINQLKDIPENQIKLWLSEIVSENLITKDWGGEKSDLYTTHLHVKGVRQSAAFLLKGPAAFEPMTIKNLGKNGDQISRLYEEPANIFIIQHCHHIKPEIHKTMAAFSADFRKISRFCIIDGEDTLRILKAYKKLK